MAKISLKNLLLSTLLIAILSVMIPQSGFSLHKTKDVSWQLLIISSDSACSNYHFQIVHKYTEITEKYLELYNVPNSRHESFCLTEKNYQGSYIKPNDIDLLVLVYDKNKGEIELHEADIGGLYTHVGDEWTHNHKIVICDCSDFYFSDPVWILSHELSHFVLNYKGFDLDVVEKKIHEWDEKYDNCVEHTYDETCTEGIIKIRTDYYAYAWTLMAPYKPAIAISIFPLENNTSILDSSFKKKMMEKVTEWWLDGKIKDGDYVSTMMIYSDEKPRSLKDNSTIPKTSSKLVLTEPLKKDRGITKYDDLNKKDNHPLSEFVDDSEVHKSMILPSWFKTRAEFWLSEKISNEEFNLFLISAIGKMNCKEGFEMVVKKSKGEAVCVRSGTVEKLMERGWAETRRQDTVKFTPESALGSLSQSITVFETTDNTLSNTSPSSAIWQYREHDIQRDFDPEFTFSLTGDNNALRVSSTFNSVGNGLIFKTFDKADLLNRDIKVTWAGGSTGAGRSPVTLLIFDGSYDRNANDDFPLFKPRLQGSGEIISKHGGVKFSEKTDIISPTFGDSQLDRVTVFIQMADEHMATEYFLELKSIEIVDLGTWNFENSVITSEQTSTLLDIGTIEATLM